MSISCINALTASSTVIGRIPCWPLSSQWTRGAWARYCWPTGDSSHARISPSILLRASSERGLPLWNPCFSAMAKSSVLVIDTHLVDVLEMPLQRLFGLKLRTTLGALMSLRLLVPLLFGLSRLSLQIGRASCRERVWMVGS